MSEKTYMYPTIIFSSIAIILMSIGCTHKRTAATFPAILNEDGTVRIPSRTIEYEETNFMSEDKVEGLWFEYDPDKGVLLELNKVETTMQTLQKAIEFGMTLVTPVPVGE